MDTIKKKLAGLKLRLFEAESGANSAQAELDGYKEKETKASDELRDTMEKLDELEGNLDETESKLNTVLNKLLSEEKKHDEVVRAKSVLDNRQSLANALIEKAEKELADCSAENSAVEEQCEGITNELEELEAKLDEEEQRREENDERVKQLELQVLQVGNNLRTMETSEDSSNQRESMYIEKIKKIGEEYAEAEERAARYEGQMTALEEQQDEVDGALQKMKSAYDDAKRAMDLELAEIAEISA